MSLSASQRAAAELLRRRRARRSLAEFVNAIEVPGRPLTEDPDEWIFNPIETSQAAHHLLLNHHLHRLHSREIRQMMVFMPPGSAKSTYGSVVFPSFVMGSESGARVIMASYATPIAIKQSRRTRQIVRSELYRPIWNAGLVAGNESVEHWSLTNGSEYMAGGILSGMTGNRATHLIIDDPVKGREDADSDTIRRKTREAYEDDLSTRLMPDSVTLIIQTRWHQDDLSGGILPVDWHGQSGVIRGRDGLDWFVLCLPAVAEHADDPLGRKIGDPLWPEWFKGEHFERFKANRRTWSALFQQVPTPDSGDYFTSDMFRYYGQRPEHLRTYGASDFAVTEGSGDYTEHCIVGVDPAGRLFVLDWWSGQTTADVWIDSLLDMAEKWKTVKWFAESGVIRRAVEPFLRKAMQERRKYQSIEWIASIQDKPTRARSIQGRFAQGMVYLPESAEWRVRIERQFLAFPAGRNDDAVDALGLIGRGLDMTQSAVEPAAKVRNEPKPGSIEWTLARTRDEKKASPYRS